MARPSIPEEEKMEFGQFVRNMRKSIGWSQTRLSTEMVYSLRMIAEIERGNKHPGDPAAFEISLRDIVKSELSKRRRAG